MFCTFRDKCLQRSKCVLDNNKILDQQCHLVRFTEHRLEKLVTQLTGSKTDHEALEGCMCS